VDVGAPIRTSSRLVLTKIVPEEVGDQRPTETIRGVIRCHQWIARTWAALALPRSQRGSRAAQAPGVGTAHSARSPVPTHVETRASSEVIIRGHHWPSDAIRRHQPTCTDTSCHGRHTRRASPLRSMARPVRTHASRSLPHATVGHACSWCA